MASRDNLSPFCAHQAGFLKSSGGLHAQDVFNLLPNLGIEELARSFAVQSNDMMLAIYLASLTRSVLALHSLIDNKARTTRPSLQ